MNNTFKKIALFYFLVLATSTYANKIDSLLLVLKTAKVDTNKVNLLMTISEESDGSPLMLKYAEQTLSLAQQLKYKKGIIQAYNQLAYYYSTFTGEYNKGIDFLLKAERLSTLNQDKTSLISIFINLAVSYDNIGSFKDAIVYNEKALKLAEELKTFENIAVIYTNTAALYRKNSDFKKALELDFKSLKIKEKIGSDKSIATSYNNIAGDYNSLNDNDRALFYFKKSLNIRTKIKDTLGIAIVYNNLAERLLQKRNETEAISYYKKSYLLFCLLKYKEGQRITLKNLSMAYRKINYKKEALVYGLKSYEVAKELNTPQAVCGSAEALFVAYEQMGLYKEAFKMQTVYYKMHDSIYNSETQKVIARKLLEQEYKQKLTQEQLVQNQKNLKTQLELKNKKQSVIYLSAALMLLFFVSIIIIQFYRLRKRSMVQLALQSEQRMLRSQMNPHFIFNSLAAIHTFIEESKLPEASEYLVQFSKLLRLVLENSRHEYISLKKEIETLNHYIGIQNMLFDNTLQYTIDIDDTIDVEKIKIPPMLAQPFIENSLKHGLRGVNGEKKLDIKFYLNPSKDKIVFELVDNGIGITASQLNKTKSINSYESIAIKLTEERLQSIQKKRNNKIEILIKELNAINSDYVKGTLVQFTIPIA